MRAVDLTRYAKLAKTQYTTAQQADTQRATVAQDEALVRQDQAQIDSAHTQSQLHDDRLAGGRTHPASARWTREISCTARTRRRLPVGHPRCSRSTWCSRCRSRHCPMSPAAMKAGRPTVLALPQNGEVSTPIDRAARSRSGGALYVEGGHVSSTGGVWTSNKAAGGTGGSSGIGQVAGGAGNASGGAIYDHEGNVKLTSDTVDSNTAHGGTGSMANGGGSTSTPPSSDGGAASGGGVWTEGGTVGFIGATISNNSTIGGEGGFGGGIGGGGGDGGGSSGGGALLGSGTVVTMTNSTVASNSALGGPGGAGEDAASGGAGGAGGAGGKGQGAGLEVEASNVVISDSTISGNKAQGGPGGAGGPGSVVQIGGGGGEGGSALAGGLASFDGPTFNNDVIAQNTVTSGTGGAGAGTAPTDPVARRNRPTSLRTPNLASIPISSVTAAAVTSSAALTAIRWEPQPFPSTPGSVRYNSTADQQEPSPCSQAARRSMRASTPMSPPEPQRISAHWLRARVQHDCRYRRIRSSTRRCYFADQHDCQRYLRQGRGHQHHRQF